MAVTPSFVYSERMQMYVPALDADVANAMEVRDMELEDYLGHLASFSPGGVIIGRGPAADKPTTATRGDLYFETDGVGRFVEYQTPTTGWTLPWGLPWGQMSVAGGGGALTTVGGTELVFITSTSFTAVANRRLKITAVGTCYGSVAGDQMRFAFRQGTTIAGTAISLQMWYPPVANYRHPFHLSADDLSTAGATQYVFCGARIAGAGTLSIESGGTFDNRIFVEDKGPSAAPA